MQVSFNTDHQGKSSGSIMGTAPFGSSFGNLDQVALRPRTLSPNYGGDVDLVILDGSRG